MKVLFVCLGNICRSPTAQAVFTHYVEQYNLTAKITLDSAGTAAWHVGKAPDERSIKHAAKRGYDLSMLRARQVSAQDFHLFDYILAMDKQNLEHLQQLKPHDSRISPKLFLDYAGLNQADVPDPYYGGEKGFEEVLDLIEQASSGLIKEIQQEMQQNL